MVTFHEWEEGVVTLVYHIWDENDTTLPHVLRVLDVPSSVTFVVNICSIQRLLHNAALSVVDRGFERRSGQTKDYKMECIASPFNTQH